MSLEPDSSISANARPQPLELSRLESGAATGASLLPQRLAPFGGVKAVVDVLAGRAATTVGELLALKAGGILELDRAVDAPFDIVLDGAVIARGQLVAVGERFGVRIVETCLQLHE